jgi:hypothetical protein
LLRERGSYTVIDRLTVTLNTREDRYEAIFSNLGVKNIPISPDYVKKYDRLLCGGIWCILQLDYEFIEEDKKNTQPIRIRKLTPIQMPHVDMDEMKNGRKCQMQGCLERADNSGYCLKHKIWASKKKKTDDASDECSVNGCTMYKTKDGDFCLYHTCNRSGCHKQKISGSVYCRKHAK